MKSRSLLVFVLVLSFAVIPSLQFAVAASSTSTTQTTTTTTSTTSAPKSPYSERLDVYTAGYSDYWQVTLSPANVSRPSIAAAESVSGLSAYELTAVKTTSANSSALLFWADGYKVLKLPFMPDAGAFLNVTATSKSAAESVAADFDSMLGADFVQIGSSGSNYTYFSPAAFATASATIFTAVPAANGGLAALTTASALASQSSPIAILTGVQSGSSFTHSVAFGSAEAGLVTNGTFALGTALNKAGSTITSSPDATSTQLVVHSLDGLVASKDAAATISNNQGAFSGTYSLSVPGGSRISPNITLLQNPPDLTAYRALDKGSAVSGDLVTVTLTMRNTATSGTIQNIAVNDNWWMAYPSLLSLSAGNSSFTIPTLAPGQNVSRAYFLKVASTTPEDLTVPAVGVSYSYSANGVTVSAATTTNQVELRTNNPGPALTIHATTDLRSGQPLGTPGHYVVTVANIGVAPALNLQVGNSTNPTLTPGGGPWTFNVTIPVTSIVDRNFTRTFTLGWTAPDGSKGTLASNPANLVLSHSGITIPFMRFSVVATLSTAAIRSGSADATYTLVNAGGVASTGVNLTQIFPTGIACKSVVNGTAKCTSSGFSVSVGSLAQGADVRGTVEITFSNDNYVSAPAIVTSTYLGLTIRNAGAAFVLPAGLRVTKTYSANPVFEGQNETVTVRVVNQGTLPVYNMSVTTQSDSFDRTLSGTLHSTYATLSPSSSESFNYTVQMLTPGNHTASGVSYAFSFGGTAPTYSDSPIAVLVYKTLQVSTTTTPHAPVEGNDFSINVNVQNPTTLSVTNISVSIPLPQSLAVVSTSGATVSGRTITIAIPSLGARGNVTESVTVKAATDGSITLGNGTLTFQYQGATVKGVVVASTITVGVDLLTRYELPISVAALLLVAVAVYMHRKVSVPQATK